MQSAESIFARSRHAYHALGFYADVATMYTMIALQDNQTQDESRVTLATFFKNPDLFCVSTWEETSKQNTDMVRLGVSVKGNYRIAFAPGNIEAYRSSMSLLAALGREGAVLRVLCKMPGNILDATNTILETASRDPVGGTSCYKLSLTQPHKRRWIWIDEDTFLIRQVRDEIQVDDTSRLGRSSIDCEGLTASSCHIVWELTIQPDANSTAIALEDE